MNEPLNQLLSEWIDGREPDVSNRGESLAEESCEQAAESLLIHGLLADLGRRDEHRDAQRIAALMQAIDVPQQTPAVSLPSPPARDKNARQIAFLTSALTVAALAMVMLFVVGPQQNVSAAMASLEKVLEAAKRPFDRTYEIRVVEEYPGDKRPRNLPEEMLQRESEEEIDGAMLYVRGTDQYVLVRSLRDGRQRMTGCDGSQSWAFREDGPVHVSSDLTRFRGGMPGQQQDIPFINIHSHLQQLQTGYDIELTSERIEASAGTVLSQLTAIRKSRDVRGPKQVDLWFDADRGTIHRMLLDGLPRGGGGPKSVCLELVDQTHLGLNFFTHEAHHETGRRIKHE
jgi:hypothetical protein